MVTLLRRHEVVGLEVIDREDRFVGTVRDTYPHDGGGEVQLLRVGVGRRFTRDHYVPAAGVEVLDGKVKVPCQRVDIQDCPPAEDCRWADPVDVARAYWITAGD